MIKFEEMSLIFREKNAKKTVFDRLTLELPVGKTIAVMGSSGCGKTSLLRLIAGLISPTSGNVTRETKSISYAFQDPALLPWHSAEENVNLVLSDRKTTLPLARKWLSFVELEGEEKSKPAALSGGMQQRVSLARALAPNADLLLLDEPFRGLDEALHEKMRTLIATHRAGKTTLLVTHDRDDLAIADAVLLLAAGSTPRLMLKEVFLSE